jgi:transcriptional regulator NrdR family protein
MPDYASALVVRSMNGKLYPFSRDKLFLSLYNALGHRQDARDVATELTHTVIGSMLRKKTVKNGAISVNDLSTHAHMTLKRFDPLAAHTYKAYHKNALSTKTSS